MTGGYFTNTKPKRSSKRSRDEATATRLWQASADLVSLGERLDHLPKTGG